MKYLLVILVASVFLGTEIFAIPTPVAQLSIYRICALSVIPLIIYFIIQRNSHIKLYKNTYSNFAVGVFIFWWIWAMISFIWTQDTMRWLQTVFLLTIGISSIIAIYLWTRNIGDWKLLLKGSWVTMTFLVGLGFSEIITNNYLFANLDKLDKYNTFDTQPLTRIPITVFENQNDFGIMLIAYVAVTLILYYMTPRILKRMGLLISALAGTFLIYQTGSRLALISVILFYIVFMALKFKIDFNRKHYLIMISAVVISVILAVIFVPDVREMVVSLIVPQDAGTISGDAARINLLRNGLIYLSLTFGFGVGAGNIEAWMEMLPIYNANGIINIHNWWAEILVGFGLIIFVLYILMYGLLIYRLFQIRKCQKTREKNISNLIIAFLIAFIFGSMTSSNNMLIEWHWVFFGLIIAYIKVNEIKRPVLNNARRRKHNEFNYNFK